MVVDVDTVWFTDPLVAVHTHARALVAAGAVGGRGSPSHLDIAVTDDGGEVCGCFVYLNNTQQTLRFWGTVLER